MSLYNNVCRFTGLLDVKQIYNAKLLKTNNPLYLVKPFLHS